MVLTRSKSRDNNLQNVKLTQEDYDAAHTLIQLRSSPRTPSAQNMKIRNPQCSSTYNLRSNVTPATYSQWDDWDTLGDPTWTPWAERIKG